MTKKKTVPFFIESDQGHTTEQVPVGKVQEEAVKQVKDGKWATVEKSDGTTEVITKDDLSDEDKELQNAWKSSFNAKKELSKKSTVTPTGVKSSTTKTLAKKFEKVTSVTCTSKAKGG